MSAALEPTPPALDRAAVAAELSAYTGASGSLCLWSTPSKISYCFPTDPDSIRRAVDTVVQLDASGESSIYHQGTTLVMPVGPHERGKNVNAHMWLRAQFDCDFGKGDDYAPDAPTVSATVRSSSLPEPTSWAHSGHGLYPRWEFSPALPNTDEVRALVEDMGAELKRAFKARGYELDPQIGKDPARVWRIPGTVNRKYPNAPVPAWSGVGSAVPYTYAELRALVPAVSVATSNVRVLPGQNRPTKQFTEDQARRYMDKLAWTPLRTVREGGRNHQLNTSALVVGHFVPSFLTEPDAREELRGIARRIGLEAAETEATITSGLGDGMRQWQAVHGPSRTVAPLPVLASGALTPAVVPSPAPAPEPAAVSEQGRLNLPADFWDAYPSLQHIRKAALARWACPDAVLGCLLARQSAYANPGDTVDLGLGPAPLTLFAIPYGPPSAGKGVAVSVARDLLPPPAYLLEPDENKVPRYRERPLGSGEGMTESYFGTVTVDDPANAGKTIRVRQQVRHNVLFVMDEGEALVRMTGRTGSTVATTIRRAWSGELLGEANASVERDRQLDRGTYSMGLIVAFQPATIAPLFDPNEVGGGTPHRFLFVAADDDTLPENPPPRDQRQEWPGELTVHTFDDPGLVKQWSNPPARTFRLVDEDALAEVERVRWDGLRRAGTLGELDGHLLQMRGRVAAHLAWLEKRTDIDGEDWRLAGIVMDASNRVRDAAVAYGRGVLAQQAQAFDERIVRREVGAHAAKLAVDEQVVSERIARGSAVLARKVLRDGPVDGLASRKLREAAGRYKSDFAACAEHAVELGWLIEEDAKQGGTRYRVGPSVGDVPPG